MRVQLTITQKMIDRWRAADEHTISGIYLDSIRGANRTAWCPIAQAAEVAGFHVLNMPDATFPTFEVLDLPAGHIFKASDPHFVGRLIAAIDTDDGSMPPLPVTIEFFEATKW